MTKILLIDNDKDFNHILAEYLSAFSWIVDSIDSSKKALTLIKNNNYDLVLCSYNILPINAYETCKKIKNSKIIITLQEPLVSKEYVKFKELGAYIINKYISPLEWYEKIQIHI